jgi:hypothetical protein
MVYNGIYVLNNLNNKNMRYKSQVVTKINNLEMMLRTLDFLVSRAESQDSILQYISEVKEKVEELGSMISIEHDEFEAYGN